MAEMMQRPTRSGPGGVGRASSVGARLRQVRDRQGLSLRTVASMLNVPPEQLARIEAGTLTHGRAVERVARWLCLPEGAGRR